MVHPSRDYWKLSILNESNQYYLNIFTTRIIWHKIASWDSVVGTGWIDQCSNPGGRNSLCILHTCSDRLYGQACTGIIFRGQSGRGLDLNTRTLEPRLRTPLLSSVPAWHVSRLRFTILKCFLSHMFKRFNSWRLTLNSLVYFPKSYKLLPNKHKFVSANTMMSLNLCLILYGGWWWVSFTLSSGKNPVPLEQICWHQNIS